MTQRSSRGKAYVKFVGHFRASSGRRTYEVPLDGPISLTILVREVCSELGKEFERSLIDPELEDPRPNALFLVNGREISALEGMETLIRPNDEVEIIPVSHGG